MITTWVVVVASYLVIGLVVVGIGLVTILRSKRRAELRNPRVLIRGDSKAKFGAAVYALDEVRKAQIEQVSVETVVSATGR